MPLDMPYPGARVGYHVWGASRPEAARPSATGVRSEVPKGPRCGEGVFPFPLHLK